MKYLLFICTIIFIGFTDSNAQTRKNTYLYLEVNKNLPVQVKLNNKSIPNNRKGYIIIPKIKPGNNILEFNFKNPSFKSHKFTISGNGKRSMGLKLVRVSNNKFVVQDVVNKRVYSDDRTMSSPPIAIKKNSNNTMSARAQKDLVKKNDPKRGVIKVYEAKENSNKKKVISIPKKKKNISKKVSQPQVAPKTKGPKREYAMYRNRSSSNTVTSSKRYKDYGKAKRARRRAQRQIAKSSSETINTKSSDQLTHQKKRQQFEAETERLARLKAKENKRLLAKKEKETRKLEREKRAIAEQYKAEREAKILKLERLQRKKSREAKKLKALKEKKARRKAEADITEAKRAKLQEKAKAYKNKPNESQVINTEPLSNQNSSVVKSRKTDVSPIRCTHQVKSERVADWTLKMHKKFDDEARTNYIKRKIGNKCISTRKLGIVLGNMDTQIGRYKLIRTIYPRIEDQANIDRLYKYFQSKSYISKLKELSANDS